MKLETTASTPNCPATSDDRKTAAAAASGLLGNAPAVRGFENVRSILRNGNARQAGFKADLIERFGDPHPPILFLHGDAHRRQRGATARFFAPKIVATRYRSIMERSSDEILGKFRT